MPGMNLRPGNRRASGGAETSFWLQSTGDLLPRPALDQSVDVDVAILGAGYTGLWTAWYLLEREPSLRVAICEKEIAGFGASGRNGGWCSAAIGVTSGELTRRYSPAVARDVVLALRDTVDEVGRVCDANGLDIHYRKGGVLRIARGPHEAPAVDQAWRRLDALGLCDGLEVLDRRALDHRVRVHRAQGALYDPNCATIHPGRLVRGLAELVEAAGATIYEQTEVIGFDTGAAPRLRTGRGDVRASTVVLAGEAWLSQLAGMRRSVLPLYSLIVLTEPLSTAQQAAIGWDRAECLSSHRYTVDYVSRTADGRVVFGGRGAPYHFRSGIDPCHDHHEPTHMMLREQLRDWFPPLADVTFTHAWGGALGMPRDWMPTIRHDPESGLAGAWGYTGQGVAASNLAGRILAQLITGTPSQLTQLPMVGHRSRRWEPEPLRWLATRYMQKALARVDRKAERTGRPPSGRTPAERLIRH